jgi:phosphate transport system substrate-binding protein
MGILVEAYKRVNPNASLEILMSDSGAGMTAAREGTCDIGMASRDLREAEMAALEWLTIAIDGIAVIVNPLNPVNNLTIQQVRDIFTGKHTVWNEFE